MKIKKVEIQAFRAYDKVKDCTFDFQTEEGRYADFVSIYAPNGFGKTSFYDAVEWAITNNIYRFIRHTINKEYAQDEKNLKYEIEGGKSPQYILRHKHSSEDLPGFVKVFLSNPDEEKSRPVPLAARIDSRDYDFEDKKSENIYFRKVILSQDSIDSFLKEDKPEVRYQKFVDFFGDKELDVCYNNILHLIKANDNKINYFYKQVLHFQKELPTINDNEILNNVNSKINDLISIGEKLSIIEPNFTELDFVDFSNQITENKINITNQINYTQENLREILLKKSELETYFISKESIRQHEESVQNLQTIKNTFLEIAKLSNEINSKTKITDEKINILLSIEEIKSSLSVYYKTNDTIKSERIKLDNNNNLLTNVLNQLKEVQLEVVDLNSKVDNFQNLIFEKENNIQDSIGLELFILENQNEINLLTEDLNSISKDIAELDKSISELTLKNRSIEFEITQIKNNEIPNSIKGDIRFISEITKIEENQKKLFNSKANLSELDKKINKYTLLTNDVKQLALLALNIIEKNTSSVCPTCGRNYESQLELINKIQSNSILDEEYIVLSADKKTIQLGIDEIEINLKLHKQTIISLKENQYKEYRDEILAKQQLKAEKADLVNLNKKRLSYFEIIKKEQQIKLGALTVSQYQEKIKNELKKLLIDTEGNSILLLSKQEKERSLSNEINIIRKTISIIEAEITALETSKDYVKVSRFSLKNPSINMIDEESISHLISEKKLEIESDLKIIANLKESQEKNSSIVSKFNESIIDSEIRLVSDLIKNVKTNLSPFTLFLESRFGDNASTYTFEQLELYFNELITGNTFLASKLNGLLTDYQKIEEYKENVLPFLKYRSIQLTIEDLEDKISTQNRIGEMLLLEKDNLSSYINQQVESFFYEDLINKLYKKIDPHPEYKNIVFKCDFSGDTPKLNVFVNGSDKEHLIPNLYFSSAQMNILSLSIFLAKAINAKDDDGQPIDCIFIDDPIQSMDSINILSTIDVLRSISLNLNKQIILSTHDENFHKLLKKKMPPNIFNSKFIELETFGKVKI
ncbi:hypothetical protein [Spirosoma gilvum]